MVIDYDTYVLNETNYYQEVYTKTQIVIGHTGRKDMRHFDAWLNRRNGNYKKTANFTIDKDGTIYQHFDPKYYSDFLGIDQDRCNVSIVLVNPGWLTLTENNVYVDWLGHIYSKDNVLDKNWRDYRYWYKYTEDQLSSLKKLINHLCEIFNINEKIISTNVYDENVDIFKGVTFRSNYSKNFTDVSPAFEIEKIN
jgi:N-acetyl-anhydromuramyl-L-alanine amidase AmpD